VLNCNYKLTPVTMPSHLRPFQMMSALPQKTLKVVPAPLAIDAVDDAPPVREADSPTVEYTCGNCGAVLMRANEDKPIHALIVHCTSCDTYNSTHSE
jgi:hypothetical protein